MRKAGLLDRKPMSATAAMMHKAKSDKGVIKTAAHIYGNYRYDYTEYESRFYFRAALTADKEILEVDLFTRRSIAAGRKEPQYRIFLDYARKDFISWNMTEEKWSNAKIDMLETGDERYRYSYRGRNFASKETLNIVNRYLKTGNMLDVETAVLDFQADVRSCNLAKKHKLITDVIDGYMNTVPDKLPADWMKFINDRALASMHSIFYRAETGVGFCTHCRLHVPVPKNAKHNMQGKCRCGSRITYKSWRKQKSVRYYRVIVSLIQKCTDGQNYVYRQFSVDMDASIESNYIPEISVHECYRKLFRFYEDGGLLQDAGAYEWGIFRSAGIERWCKAGTVNYGRIYGGGGYAKSFLYTANLNRILKDTCLRYIPVSEIIKQSDDKLNIIAVLGDMGMSFPYEAFWKMGLRQFVIERVKRDGAEGLTRTDYRFDKSPWKYLRITKEHLHQAIRLNAGDKLVRIIQRIDEFGVRITDEQAVWLDKYVGVHVVLGYFGYHTPHRIIRYMQERLCVGTNDNPNHDGSSNLSLWVDYIDTARQLGWNLRDRSIFFPQNVQRAHDEAVRVFDIQKDKEDASKMRQKDKIMNQNAKEIKKAFCYRDSNFVIKVPGCYLDFKHEGHAQHNCVATYYERAVEGKCIILFIRQKQCPNKSYCTVEVRNRQGKFHIEQNRAAYNKAAPKAAVIFMEKAVAAAQKIADSMAAEEREQIRIQAAG